MRKPSSPTSPTTQETPQTCTRLPAYRRLRLKADAQLAAEQTHEAEATLRVILRLQHLSQIK